MVWCLFAEVDSELVTKSWYPSVCGFQHQRVLAAGQVRILVVMASHPQRESEPPGGLLSSWLGTRLIRAVSAADSVPGLGAAAGVGP